MAKRLLINLGRRRELKQTYLDAIAAALPGRELAPVPRRSEPLAAGSRWEASARDRGPAGVRGMAAARRPA
ncbi:hypothetical protein ALISP_5762 [Alicycliphilus sp. B1]|nr:hypothetical protein ALISP_5762 [Alicycliphilus sp. B1]